MLYSLYDYPDNKEYGANMGHIWGRQDPGGPHVGPMDFAILVVMYMAVNEIDIQLSGACATIVGTGRTLCNRLWRHQ